MPTDIKLKNSVTATNAPTSLQQGEVAINITDKKVWVGNAATTPVQLLGDGGSGSFTSIAFGDGTVSLPSITNIGDTNTGIFFPAADTIAFTEGGVESMRITSTGSVGINTNNPGSTKLFVQGIVGEAAAFISTPSTGTTVRSNNTFRVQSEASGRDVYMQFSDNVANSTEIGMVSGSQYFCTGSAERMRITSAGNLLVNTSSVLLAGTGSIQAQAIGNGGAILSKSSEWSTYTQYIWNATTAENSRFVSFNTEGTATERGSIDYNRAAGLTRYNTTSDAELKNLIGDSDNKKSIDILSSTRIREYAWKDDAKQKPQIGVIAQELYETYKGAVVEGGEDANGNYVPWAVDKTAFTFHLIAGWQVHQKLIQEQQVMIEALTTRLNALEGK